MGLRFRKSFNLIPGIKLNLSKSGPSLSIGRKGMTLNVGSKGTKTTVGLPGSGVSYSSYESYGKTGTKRLLWIIVFILITLLVITQLPAH